jgi:hypothetical protein
MTQINDHEIMKSPHFIIILMLMMFSCSTTNKLYDEVFDNALIGQKEMKIYARLGKPTKTEAVRGGGKVLIYEFDSKGMYLTPYKSAIKYDATVNPSGERQGWTYTFGEYTAANDPKYTIYQRKVSFLKVFLNREGTCTRYEQNLPQEQLDIYHERFKHFNSKN